MIRPFGPKHPWSGDLILLATFLAILLLFPVLVGTLVFTVELFFGIVPLRRNLPEGRGMKKTVVVIPAHNEEKVIASTVSRLLSSRLDSMRILVVADNCADKTAEIARQCGAEVVERNDPQAVGKGFALARAQDHLTRSPPDVVIVLDADCEIDGSSLRMLSERADYTGFPCQAVNLLDSKQSRSPLVRISSFAFMVKNVIRQRALQRIAGCVHLTGTGMALPWTLFQNLNLATAAIVEDLGLGLDLASRGHPPQFVETATVRSPSASQTGTLDQRRRWEGGFLQTAAVVAPRAIGRSLKNRDWRALAAALDLIIPPVALLVALNFVAVSMLGAAAFFGIIQGWLAWLALGLFSSAMLGVLAVWATQGRHILSFWDLLLAPTYVVWKIPHYLRLLIAGAPRQWIRGER